MTGPLPDIRTLKPAGGKRSSKREQIVNVFLRQEGHLSAYDLVDVSREHPDGNPAHSGTSILRGTLDS